jgi:hypothetical protein
MQVRSTSRYRPSCPDNVQAKTRLPSRVFAFRDTVLTRGVSGSGLTGIDEEVERDDAGCTGQHCIVSPASSGSRTLYPA